MSKWVQNKDGILIPKREAGFIQPGIGLMSKKHGGSGGDPYWNNVVSLLHLDGANGSTNFVDEISGVSWTGSGNAVLSSVQKKFGVTSLYIPDLDSDIYRNTSPLSVSDKMTMECFFYCASAITSAQYARTVFGQSGSGGARDQYAGFIESPNTPIHVPLMHRDSNLGTPVNLQGTPAIQMDTWGHFALCWDGIVLYMFVNGSLTAQISVSGGWANTGYAFRIGRYLNPPYSQYRGSICGYIDEVRITKGVARYTSNFTTPSAPFPNHA